MPIRLALAGSTPLGRDSLERAIDSADEIEVVATSTGVDDTIIVFEEHDIDVALVDIRPDPVDGLRIARWVSANVPATAIVVLATAHTDRIIVESYTAHAHGLVTESTTWPVLIETIGDVASGLRLMSSEDARAAQRRLLAAGRPSGDQLSDADIRLAELVSRGLTDAEIAGLVHLSVQTVRNRVSRLLRSLGLVNRVQLAVFACRHLDPMMLVPDPDRAIPAYR